MAKNACRSALQSFIRGPIMRLVSDSVRRYFTRMVISHISKVCLNVPKMKVPDKIQNSNVFLMNLVLIFFQF